ncbi:MAG: hypothetical protein ACRC42_02595 [Mycoplasma sp.]
MLKAVFMDLIPYIVQQNAIFSKAWNNILNREFPEYIADEDFCEIIDADLLEPNILNKISEKLSKEEMEKLRSEYLHELVNVENDFFENFKFCTIIQTFFDKANENDCHIYVMSRNYEFLDKLVNVKWPKNVDCIKIPENVMVNSEWITNFAAEHSIASNELFCLTQEQGTINDIISNGLFCATVSHEESEVSNLHITTSIGKIDFDEMSFSFYESQQDEGEDL